MGDGWRLLMGLGNPGERYQNTRHNTGFMALATLARSMGLEEARTFKRSLVAKGRLGQTRVILAWPQTYMNLSGLAARELVDFYKIPLPDVLVIHDDMDFEVGRLKAAQGGGVAGHNGLASLAEAIGEGFARIRIGIGRPDRDLYGGDWTPWVLSAFAASELETLDRSLALAAKAAKAWATGDLAAAQRLVNVKPKKPKAPKAPEGEAGTDPKGPPAKARPADEPSCQGQSGQNQPGQDQSGQDQSGIVQSGQDQSVQDQSGQAPPQ